MPETTIREVILRIELPESLAAFYEKQAQDASKPIQDIIVDRLKRCRNHAAQRPVYFDDTQRNELEHILGGHLINTSEQALTRIQGAMRLKLNGTAIQLDESRLSRIRSRGRKDRTIDQNLQHLVPRLIDAYLRGDVY